MIGFNIEKLESEGLGDIEEEEEDEEDEEEEDAHDGEEEVEMGEKVMIQDIT